MRLVVAMLLCLLGPMAGASAQSTDDLLAKFASTKFDDIEAGINGLATSGDSRALPVLQALTDGRLLLAADKHAYIKAADGSLIDAGTGDPAPAEVTAASLKAVRVNNRIRRAVEAAMGGLTLLSADPVKRQEAAQAVLRSREASILPVLEQALAQEQDEGIKLALAQARAAIVLGQANAAA
ncbi:MAG: hypothetical protein WAS21_07280, partial [Geminicoccaceae bacterium]